jgi:periplasmic copper chaperone A
MLKSGLRMLLALTLLRCVAPVMAQVVVTEPWVRGTVEGQTSTGAYMTLSSAHDVTLIGVSSDVAGHTSIHQMQMHGDMMMMRPVDRVPIRAGQPFVLEEGHYHMMLDDLKRRLNVGDDVGLDLQFLDANGTRQVVHVVARVRELAAHDSPHMHSGMGHE